MWNVCVLYIYPPNGSCSPALQRQRPWPPVATLHLFSSVQCTWAQTCPQGGSRDRMALPLGHQFPPTDIPSISLSFLPMKMFKVCGRSEQSAPAHGSLPSPPLSPQPSWQGPSCACRPALKPNPALCSHRTQTFRGARPGCSPCPRGGLRARDHASQASPGCSPVRVAVQGPVLGWGELGLQKGKASLVPTTGPGPGQVGFVSGALRVFFTPGLPSVCPPPSSWML